jgi:DNA-binding NarL/FixJ family response regulator
MKILIVDQNPEVITALKLVLEQKHGISIIGESSNIIDMFSNFTQQCPDVVILDVDLQGIKPIRVEANQNLMNLFKTLHTLCPAVYVIALSYLPNLEHICLQAGADAFACKSDPPDKLLALLDKFK